MDVRPSYEDSHLIVAAVRVLSNNATKPPTPEDVATLLDKPPDLIRSMIIVLGSEGILRVVENPFEIRAEVGDYLKIEDLPRASDVPSIKSELDEFVKRKKEAEDETGKALSLDEIERKNKEKMARLEEEMRRMRGKPEPPID
jgi:benzoyl-CoA reductase/2-hydroxyglutaryl-CoA dehydratase subunit BcrC/BadD/HgdB